MARMLCTLRLTTWEQRGWDWYKEVQTTGCASFEGRGYGTKGQGTIAIIEKTKAMLKPIQDNRFNRCCSTAVNSDGSSIRSNMAPSSRVVILSGNITRRMLICVGSKAH